MTENQALIMIAAGVGIVVGSYFLGAFIKWLGRDY
jgi:hypothetical protein